MTHSALLSDLWRDPKRLTLIALIGAASAFVAALISQYGFGLQPCKLCLWQRYPYAIGGVLALAALLRPASARPLLALAALAFLANTGLAAFHSGVEFGWWKGFASCSAPAPEGLTPEELMEQLRNTSLVRCDERQPFFLGLSMTNWNLIVCAGFAALLGRAATLAARPEATPAGYSSSSASQ